MFRPACVAVVLVLLASGCASFTPLPLDEVPFRERAQTRTRADVTVSVAVLTPRETRKGFGVRMEAKGIQPVWLRIQNDTDHEYIFLSASLDPEYYSSHETSWKNHFFLGGGENEKMDDYIFEQEIGLVVEPRSVNEGFLYTNRDRGVKFVSVDLLADHELLEFGFVIEIPGFKADYQQVDFDNLYPPEEIREVDVATLREELLALPCCVLGGDEKTDGDPLNLVVIGNAEYVFGPFLRRRWHVTERIHAGSLWGTVRSSVFGSAYKHSPISSLYLYGRPQDVGLQKARGTVDERNHLRLWLSPLRFEGKEVWVGQISRDIGVRLSRKTFVTHEIDPNVDEARDYVAQDLILSRHVEALGFVVGVGEASRDKPRHNYTRSPYFTDGQRAVILISDDATPLDEIDFFEWH